ncbi:MAG: hypothetical protein K2M69_06545 [Muribaculaceae bacterium]|nr:hypothetical protein [Muribaculaceae bacterium]
METIFNNNPDFDRFLTGEIGCFVQMYEGIRFFIFRNLDDSCEVAIAATSLVTALDNRDICERFAIEAKEYINSKLSC